MVLSLAGGRSAAHILAISRRLTLECGDMGRYANAQNLLTQCTRFDPTPDDASTIIDVMQQTVQDRWYDVARKTGVSEKDRERIAGAFAYEGFRLVLTTLTT